MHCGRSPRLTAVGYCAKASAGKRALYRNGFDYNVLPAEELGVFSFLSVQ